jgi:glycosyltransferase involved in cell wall biosynthesis
LSRERCTMGKSKILFLCPYPSAIVASQRFRFEQYFEILKDHGFCYKVSAFTSKEGWRILQSKGKVLLKLVVLISGFGSRFFMLLKIFKYGVIFIHREAAPIGPPIIEWLIAKVLRKKIIYDFDDSIWLTDNVNQSAFQKFLKWRKKISSICKWSYKVSAGNEYLASFARQFSQYVVVNPTTIDTENLHNKILYETSALLKQENQIQGIVIGWTGTYTTMKYLEQLLPVLQKIEITFPTVKFLIIADSVPEMPLRNIIFKKWSKETEIKDLLLADIGIMPLPDDDWAKGKCGFKALQYMSLEIPAIVSAVGVNETIIQHGENGFCCKTRDDWFSCISKLILDPSARLLLGQNGRKTVVQAYSIGSNFTTFLSLFQ